MLARADERLKEIRRTPYEGIGKPKPLKFNRQGCRSRRMNAEYRLVYMVKGDEVVVLQSRYHYEGFMTDLLDNIRERQRRLAGGEFNTEAPPPHRPEMLYIGCIDARLDPIDDIGIPKGKALIFRNIAALVREAPEANMGASLDGEAMVSNGEIAENVSVGAALEFFIEHIPSPQGRMKHIVVSGHTDCGGIRACLHDGCSHDSYLTRYLRALSEAREQVQQDTRYATEDEKLRALEEACVRRSIENLKTYAVVQHALEAGSLQLHGWVIDTATRCIAEMDAGTGEFIPLNRWGA